MLIDLRNRANEPVVQELLSYAIGMPVPEKLKQIAKSYREDVNLALWGVEDDGSLIGCLGVRCSPKGMSCICPFIRRTGVAMSPAV